MGIGIGFDFIGVTNVEHNITLNETFMMFFNSKRIFKKGNF